MIASNTQNRIHTLLRQPSELLRADSRQESPEISSLALGPGAAPDLCGFPFRSLIPDLRARCVRSRRWTRTVVIADAFVQYFIPVDAFSEEQHTLFSAYCEKALSPEAKLFSVQLPLLVPLYLRARISNRWIRNPFRTCFSTRRPTLSCLRAW
jgi:hypothetical protein